MIDIYAFTGDGEVNAEEFDAGERVAQVKAPGTGVIRVAVTEAFRETVDTGERFIGFRLSTDTDDRCFLGEIADLADPALTTRYGG